MAEIIKLGGRKMEKPAPSPSDVMASFLNASASMIAAVKNNPHGFACARVNNEGIEQCLRWLRDDHFRMRRLIEAELRKTGKLTEEM